MGIRKVIADKVTNWLSAERDVTDFPMCDFERISYELRPCDVVLMEGRSHVSDVIKYVTQSAWSHSALYIGRIHDISNPELRNRVLEHFDGEADTQLLVEGLLGHGTVITPLSAYHQDHIRVCRPSGLSQHDAQRVIDYVITRLGHDYDVRQILDLGRFMLPWSIMPRKWRSSLFTENPSQATKTVCSTIIAEAFSSVHFPILPHITNNADTGLEMFHRNPRLYTPRDFDYSPYFEIIKYPYVGIDEQPAYRKLPWNKDGVIINGNERVKKIRRNRNKSKDDELLQN